MPSAVNESMDRIHDPTQDDESFQGIDEEQIDFEEDIIDTSTNNSDTWSNNGGLSGSEHESENVFSDNDEINSSPEPPMETASPSVPEVVSGHIGSSNAAAGRNRGRNVARRGRINPHLRTALPWYVDTPFQRGVTFNGFAKNLELEEIVDCTVDPQNVLLFHVKWRNDGDKIRQIECSLLRTYSPQLLMDFYEKKMMEYRR